MKENIEDGMREKQMIAEKRKETQNRGKLRKKGINLQKWKQQEKDHFFKRKHKLLINVLS
jgi:alpha/beta superfamily hydrolase